MHFYDKQKYIAKAITILLKDHLINMNTNWEQLITINKKWVHENLNNHCTDTYEKIVVRAYTVKATGTTITSHALTDTLKKMIVEYAYGNVGVDKDEIISRFFDALSFFGKKDPETDGKYGELVLFALVESVLNCKMVAHKIRTLTNPKDQVKGGDGIFLGNYPISEHEKSIAYLIGESKIMTNFSAALKDAYESINRFHDYSASEFINTELIVARDNLLIDDSIDIEELYDRLTPTSALFKKQILVHPILIMYNSSKINSSEEKSISTENLELLIKQALKNESKTYYTKIADNLNNFPRIKRLYLDFFIVPYNDVKEFRFSMYHKIHGVPYTK